jgi:ankyrin repeat protein
LEAATSGQSTIACALLEHGVDPNLCEHGGRLGKTSGRDARKQTFHSNPLHLACSKGDSMLVKKLLEKGCKFNSPDATGSFPIHLAASSTNSGHNESDKLMQEGTDTAKDNDEDQQRYDCVRSLLEAGAPLTMKDGNKQTVLHCAARAGHRKLLKYLMKCWSSLGDATNANKDKSKVKASPYDWTDRWFRTPVHWAVLNGRVEALKVLLDGGCSPNPPKPKSNRQTSVAIESPLEICERLYGDDSNATGRQLRELLLGTSSLDNEESKA